MAKKKEPKSPSKKQLKSREQQSRRLSDPSNRLKDGSRLKKRPGPKPGM